MKKPITKQEFIKGLGIGVISLAIIVAGEAALNKANAPKVDNSISGDYIPGTYTAAETGFGEGVAVTVTIYENGGIADVTLEGPNETPDIGGAALTTLRDQIMAAQSAEIDGVSGASLTSGAVKTAMGKALAEAGGEAVEEAPAEEAVEETAEEATEEAAEETAEEAPAEEAAEEAEEAPAEAASYTDGTYEAEATGFGEGVKVTITVAGGEITEATVDAPNETPEIGGKAAEELGSQIVAAQGAAIDGVSGATLTTGAVKAAAEEALAAASGAAVEETAEEATEETAEETAEEAPAEEAAEETEEAPAEAASYTDGTYEAEATGFGEGVKVTITVAGGEITEATVDAPNETPEIGGKAAEELGSQIVAAQGAAIDGVSGATLTTGAVKAAAEEALAAASGAAAEETAEEATEETAEETAEEAPAEEAAEETEEAPAEAASYTDGTYEAEATGFGEGVKVTITVAGGEITEATVDAPNETPEIGGKAAEELANQIVAAQGAEIDGVSGASLTSGAVREAAAAALAAASGEEVEAAPTPEGDDLFIAGTYEGTAKGFGGDIVVTVEVTENEITDIQIVGDHETENIGTFAVELLDDEMLEMQSPKVDALTGATVSSNAIVRAATDALKAAGADMDKFPEPEEKDENAEKAEETLETDIVIIGAGGAGMTAAIKATQAGKDVILLEKMPYAGGNTTKATGGMNAAETHYQEEQGIEDSIQTFIDDTMEGGHQKNDIELVTKMAEDSAAAIDWLDSIGAPLPKISFSGGATNQRIHAPEDGSGVGAYLVTAFLKQLDELDINVMYNTKATDILLEDGTVVGVAAESEDTAYTINADAVILTTGGFGGNMDMIVKYREDLDGTVSTSTPGATGDGIVMAENIGAGLVDIEEIQLHPTVEQATKMLITESVRGDGAILVNQSGERFTNELLTRDAVSAAELEQEGSYAYLIFDQTLRENLKATEKYVAIGIVSESETVEGLAEQIGMDPAVLAATVEKWNQAVADQNDEEFGRDTGMENDISKAPYYAIKIAPGIHHTMGGVKINVNAEVINTDGEVIPGLFAAGEVTGGVHGGNRLGGNAVADIVVFGNVAGDSAVAYCE